MMYKVKVVRKVTETIDVTIEVPFMGTSEEDKFQMEDRAEELAIEQANEIDVKEWTAVVESCFAVVQGG